ncbi:MAG TPA: LysR family transcriptional regulator, partial [Rubrivivax sp.]|nr:LysR family transcriptional regulator [Rubrivivax sp.]
MPDSADGFDWALVRSFLAVLEAGSLTGAARQTGALQSTLSRHISDLEAQLRTPLFERTGRGVSPTAAGLAIADSARRMREQARALGAALSAERGSLAGTVRLSVSQAVANFLLPPVLAALRRAEPAIQIELLVSNQITNLLQREADIAVRMVRPRQTGLVARKLGEFAIGAYASQAYLAQAGLPAEPASLFEHALIGYDRDRTIEEGFARLGYAAKPELFVLRTDDQVAYAQAVAQGMGIGFMADFQARALGLIPVLPQLRIPPMPCWLAVHREVRSNRRVRRVFDFLAQALVVRPDFDSSRAHSPGSGAS